AELGSSTVIHQVVRIKITRPRELSRTKASLVLNATSRCFFAACNLVQDTDPDSAGQRHTPEIQNCFSNLSNISFFQRMSVAFIGVSHVCCLDCGIKALFDETK